MATPTPPPPPSSTGNISSSSSAPKILLSKPISTPTDSSINLRSRLPPIGSLNLLSDSWDFHSDRALPFLTDNIDFTVVGVIGSTGVGKSTILNHIYGFDGTSSGILPPFATQTEETRAMARHCTTSMELRISSERIILLDTQPINSPSILSDTIRPDGLSTIPLFNGEVLPADLTHEITSIQLGVFLASICHVLIVVSEGVHDVDMWEMMKTVEMLKHGVPDPSTLTPNFSHASNLGLEENKDNLHDPVIEYSATPVFVHTKLRDDDISHNIAARMRKKVSQYFNSSDMVTGNKIEEQKSSVGTHGINLEELSSKGPNLFLLPQKNQDDSQRDQYESYATLLGKLRDQILSMNCRSFAKTISERDWMKNSARIWETVKNSPVIAEYCKTLQSTVVVD